MSEGKQFSKIKTLYDNLKLFKGEPIRQQKSKVIVYYVRQKN